MRDPIEVTYTRTGRLPVGLAELAALITIPPWHADAACREHPEVRFFLEHGETAEIARGVCAGCLVRAECLATAVGAGAVDGVWGGTTQRERRHLRRRTAA